MLSLFDMKTLVIPDLHHATGWVDVVHARERPDRTVFLGDAFDSPQSRRSVVLRVIDFVDRWTRRDDTVWLLGNHDARYLFPQSCAFMGAGYNKFTNREALKRLGFARTRMKFVHYEQGWFLSHAGLREGFAHPVLGFDPDWISAQDREVAQLALYDTHPWLAIGDARSLGSPRGLRGGVIWQDWNDEFQPIPGVNQIVGHTRVDTPETDDLPDSLNLNIDCSGKYYAVIIDGEVEVYAHGLPVIRDGKPLA